MRLYLLLVLSPGQLIVLVPVWQLENIKLLFITVLFDLKYRVEVIVTHLEYSQGLLQIMIPE